MFARNKRHKSALETKRILSNAQLDKSTTIKLEAYNFHNPACADIGIHLYKTRKTLCILITVKTNSLTLWWMGASPLLLTTYSNLLICNVLKIARLS